MLSTTANCPTIHQINSSFIIVAYQYWICQLQLHKRHYFSNAHHLLYVLNHQQSLQLPQSRVLPLAAFHSLLLSQYLQTTQQYQTQFFWLFCMRRSLHLGVWLIRIRNLCLCRSIFAQVILCNLDLAYPHSISLLYLLQ